MEIKKEKIIKHKEIMIVGYKCDCFGRTENTVIYPYGWHQFNLNIADWGNDAVDSYEYFDACGPICYITLLNKAVDILKGSIDAEVDDFHIDFARKLVGFLKITFDIKEL